MLTDSSLMPSGQHKGIKMIDVPAKDLLWLYENNRATAEVSAYIEDNLEVLKAQVKKR